MPLPAGLEPILLAAPLDGLLLLLLLCAPLGGFVLLLLLGERPEGVPDIK